MKKLSWLFLIIVFAGCASSKNQRIEILSGKWELFNFPASGKTYEEIFGERRPHIQFDTQKSTVGGNTGCNHFSSSYSVDGKMLTIDSRVITTKMACPGYEESVFLDALLKVNRFEIKDEQLSLSEDSTLIMAFRKITENISE